MRAVKPVNSKRRSRSSRACRCRGRTGRRISDAQPQRSRRLGIPLQAFEGVYWAQCLERGFDKLISEGVDAILTIDYDTVYTRSMFRR
jgi:hypothetical protein